MRVRIQLEIFRRRAQVIRQRLSEDSMIRRHFEAFRDLRVRVESKERVVVVGSTTADGKEFIGCVKQRRGKARVEKRGGKVHAMTLVRMRAQSERVERLRGGYEQQLAAGRSLTFLDTP